jgi:hypothetical protein
MLKRAFSVAVGLLGLGLPLFAQEADVSEHISLRASNADGLVNAQPALNPADKSEAFRGFPSLALSDGRLFSFAGPFAWMQTSPDFLPPVSAPEPRRSRKVAAPDRDSSDFLSETRANPVYTSGEVGFMYGRSTGKYGGSFEQGYIIGEVGNDKFHISAGASYESSNVRFPRWGR